MQREQATTIPETVVRIAIAGHQPALLDGFILRFARIPGCEVVLLAADGQQLLHDLPTHLPVHIAVVDVHTPAFCGFHTIAQLREHFPETLPVALSREGDEVNILRAHKAGARGHLLKTDDMPELIRFVDRMMTTGRYLTDRALQYVCDNPDGLTPHERECARLRAAITDRECEVIRTLFTLEELTVAQAGQALGISPRTVETHLANISIALGVTSRTGLLLKALFFNLLDPIAPPLPRPGKKQ